jgi:hypothetical protein
VRRNDLEGGADPRGHAGGIVSGGLSVARR